MTRATAVNEQVHRSIRKANPGVFQSDQEVIDQFVVRNHEFGMVLEVLRGNTESSSCQHILVVGPRGRGKTMLLARVAAEIRTDDELSGRLLPVRFMEESQEISGIADFWLETLFHLARQSKGLDADLARELRETHAALSGRWREKSLSDHARAAVLSAADRLGPQARAHGRESADAVRERGPGLRLAASRRAPVGTPDHAARFRHQPIRRAGRRGAALLRAVPDCRQ